MAGRGAARENLDDDHATAATRTGSAGSRLAAVIGVSIAWGFCLASSSRARAMLSAQAAFGEQAVVSDAVEATRHDMDEEATDELVCCERHHLVAIGAFDPIVLVLELIQCFC